MVHLAAQLSEHLTRDISAVSAEIMSILSDPPESKRFLSSRGVLAQQLLDLLQDLLDSSPEVAARPLLSKALLKLSGECGLHPTCFALDGLEKLGQQVAGGGYGDIWKGRVGGQIVAVKSMRQFQNQDIRASLKKLGREALIWRQLSHPNLLPFLGLYTYDGRLCLISPWMDNGDLKSFLNNPPNGINHLALVADTATGLQYLHRENIVHGDLKTANILVTPSGRACIADFGLSSIVGVLSLNTTLSSRSGQPGTLRYQAPELLSDQRPNHFGSDVYAFACLCYEILSGKPPFFDIHNEVAIILKVVEGGRPSPLEGVFSANLWLLLEDCWTTSPDKRPTMTVVIQRLVGEGIGASVTRAQPDWDETYSARFRRSVQEWPLLPSVLALERKILGYATSWMTPQEDFEDAQHPPTQILLPPAELPQALTNAPFLAPGTPWLTPAEAAHPHPSSPWSSDVRPLAPKSSSSPRALDLSSGDHLAWGGWSPAPPSGWGPPSSDTRPSGLQTAWSSFDSGASGWETGPSSRAQHWQAWGLADTRPRDRERAGWGTTWLHSESRPLSPSPSRPSLESEGLVPATPWSPLEHHPVSGKPIKLQIHPWLDGDSPSPIFHVDFAPKTLAPLHLAEGSVSWISSTDEFADSAFHPPLAVLRVVHPHIPFWPMDLKKKLTFGATMPRLSVGDVVRRLHKALQKRITESEWEMMLDEDERDAIKNTFVLRCRGEALRSGVPQEQLKEREIEMRNDGVKRVDFLLGKTTFRGLVRVDEHADGILRVMTV
ncbi:kinase-like domain-containing protein [Mycena filopes]|nr:kinase-like domain-containing protein [Mycena filopes]